MSHHFGVSRYRACRTLLAAAIGVVLNPAYSATVQIAATKSTGVPRTTVIPVTKCEDDLSPGTLRYEVAFASSGDTVDLSALACSTITLSGLAIAVPQDFLYLKGPTNHELTIDAAFNSRVLVHLGAAKIDISDLTFANGHNFDDASPYGGCIYSESSVVLRNSKITNCSVSVGSLHAGGGGVATLGDLFLYGATIESSYAASSAYTARVYGGGAYIGGDLRAFNSVIDSNSAETGGGMYVSGSVTIVASTISRNAASSFIGGIALVDVGGPQDNTITNSTISQNSSSFEYGGIWTERNLTIANSTIAFNHGYSSSSDRYVGIHSAGASITVQSSIVSNNTGRDGAASDIGGSNGALLAATSAKNLITSSNFPLPPDTVTRCARLQPLANNGGKTPTHALSLNSTAIDKGNDGGLMVDQRGAPRAVNGVADIGSVERQLGEVDDRDCSSGFDELCDQ